LSPRQTTFAVADPWTTCPHSLSDLLSFPRHPPTSPLPLSLVSPQQVRFGHPRPSPPRLVTPDSGWPLNPLPPAFQWCRGDYFLSPKWFIRCTARQPPGLPLQLRFSSLRAVIAENRLLPQVSPVANRPLTPLWRDAMAKSCRPPPRDDLDKATPPPRYGGLERPSRQDSRSRLPKVPRAGPMPTCCCGGGAAQRGLGDGPELAGRDR
jgi:hypothetical protein